MNNPSLIQQLIASPPPVVSLLNPDNNQRLLPERILNDPLITAQRTLRVRLLQCLEEFDTQVPATTSIDIAIEGHMITAQQVVNLYEKLTEFLLFDDNHQRLLLYLPFELLPQWGYKSSDKSISRVLSDFLQVYQRVWNQLFAYGEARPLYTDGDFDNHQKTKIINKAAHIGAILIHKGYLTQNNFHRFAQDYPRDTLLCSIDEAINATSGLRMHSPHIWEGVEFFQIDVAQLGSMLVQQAHKHEVCLQIEFVNNYRTQGAHRAQSLFYAHHEKARHVFAVSVTHALVKQSSPIDTVVTLLNQMTKDLELTYVLRIIRYYYSELIRNNDTRHTAQALMRQVVHQLLNFAETSCEMVKREALSVLRYGAYHGSIQLPNALVPRIYQSPFQQYQLPDISTKGVEVVHVIQQLELMKILYPLAIVYGSHAKGCANPNSKLDIAVFMRPNVSTELVSVLSILEHKLSTEYNASLTLLKLDGSESNLRPDYEWSRVNPAIYNNILFQGIWCGTPSCISSVQAALLPSCMYNNALHTLDGFAHNVYPEHDQIRYQLMYERYRSLFPPIGGISGPSICCVDGYSTFWDSGFRRLATQLYISRVWAPELSL